MGLKLKKKIIKNPKIKQFYDIEKHGITQSLISMFLDCRQKAKFYLQGWDSKYHKLPLTEGSVGHEVLQHAYTDIMKGKLKHVPDRKEVLKYTHRVEKQWLKENPRSDKQGLEYLEYSLATMEATLPPYFDYYKKDLKEIKWLGLEEKFCLPYQLPDGRKTVLRGKKDGEFLNKGLWLFETKFKSQIPEGNLLDTLALDTQILLYLRELAHKHKKQPAGTLYNIVRRTCLKQRKDETLVMFSKRLSKDIETRPDFYFMRYEIAIDKNDLKNFEIQLFGLVKDFYDWWQGIVPHYKNTYNCLGKYGRCLYLGCCSAEDFSGVQKRKVLFKELEDF